MVIGSHSDGATDGAEPASDQGEALAGPAGRHPTGARRQWSGAARRLLEAAGDLFYRQGARSTTVREITGACGLSPGALYNHFSSKDELLFELVRARHLHLEHEVAAAQAAAGGDPVAELAAIVRVYVEVHVRHRSGARVANREFRQLRGEQLAEVVAIRRRLRDRMAQVLAEGSRRGLFDLAGGAGMAATTITAASILDLCIHCGEWLHEDGPMAMGQLQACFETMALRMAGATPAEVCPAPAGRQGDTAPAGRQGDTAPAGRQVDTAPAGRQGDTAPASDVSPATG